MGQCGLGPWAGLLWIFSNIHFVHRGIMDCVHGAVVEVLYSMRCIPCSYTNKVFPFLPLVHGKMGDAWDNMQESMTYLLDCIMLWP